MGLWGGRFSEPTDADLRALNDSIGFDRRMYRQDIRASQTYARGIAEAGIITTEEMQQLLDGLQQILIEFEENRFQLRDGDEDIHTAVERRLTELVGAVGGKLHTGRSRNDQVATDFRLWVMDAIKQFDEQIAALQLALLEKSEGHIETVMPGFTHLQPAQPITAAHWLMSFFWMLSRDRDRLMATRDRAAVLPLGSGALAGNPYDVDRAKMADELGFSSYSQNSLDAVSDRDYVAETMFDLALLGTHLSRFAEDILLYSNPLFGFVTLNDRYSTGSSLMPQKRNADPMELTRGKTGRLIGDLTGFLSTLKGLPSGYNKDLQEDKEALFDAFDTLVKLMPVITAMVATLQLNPDAMRRGLTEDLLATDIADYLVRKGLPFREAHHVVGRIVRLATDNKVNLSELSFGDFKATSDLFEQDIVDVFNYDRSVSQRRAAGGTAPEAVRLQIEQAKAWMAAHSRA